MPLDANIIMGLKPLEMPDYAKIQSDAQVNQLNQMKLQEAQQGMAETNAMRDMWSQPGFNPNSPEAIQQMYRINPKIGMQYETERGVLVKAKIDAAKAKYEGVQNLIYQASNNPDDTSVSSIISQGVRAGILDENDAPQLEAQLLTIPLDKRKDAFTRMSVAAKEAFGNEVISARDLLSNATTRLGQQSTAATALAGQRSTAATALAGQRITAAGQNKPVWSESLQAFVSPSGAVVPANIPAGAPTKTERESTQALKQGARQALLTAGYNPKTGKDTVEPIIEKTMGGFFPSSGRTIAGAFNIATPGGEALAKAKVISGRITLDMLQGKLGQGISEGDRQMIQQLSGSIGDGMLPVGDRLSAWKQFRDIMVKYSGVGEQRAPAQGAGYVVTRQQLQDAATKHGKTFEQALSAAKQKGYTVQ
jgi:hypothetical protein